MEDLMFVIQLSTVVAVDKENRHSDRYDRG